MQQAPVDAPLTDDETGRLESLLAAARGARLTRLDELQGLCVALAMGPDAEISNRWLEAVLGADETHGAQDAELLVLLERFRASTEAALEARSLSLRIHRTRTGRDDYARWCSAFLDGVEISETEWFAAADAQELDELLFPIEALALSLIHI